MFAALTIPRLIEAVRSVPGLSSTASWRSADDVCATDLPLARACEKVLASMQSILAKTSEECGRVMAKYDERIGATGAGNDKIRHLALTNASEVKVVRHVEDIVCPKGVERFRAREISVDVDVHVDVQLEHGAD